MADIEKLKDLLFKDSLNDFFDEIEKVLPDSDSVKNEYYSLKGDWNYQSNNFKKKEWKEQMIEFIKENMNLNHTSEIRTKKGVSNNVASREEHKPQSISFFQTLKGVVILYLLPVCISAIIAIGLYYFTNKYEFLEVDILGLSLSVSGPFIVFFISLVLSIKYIKDWFYMVNPDYGLTNYKESEIDYLIRLNTEKISFAKSITRKITNTRKLIDQLIYANGTTEKEAILLDQKMFVSTRFTPEPKDYYNKEVNIDKKAKVLLPLLTKQILRKNNPNNQHLVLGDSGTGKSTFLIRLYLKLSKSIHNYNIVFIPFNKLDIFILEAEKLNTDFSKIILLLDAFDEMPDAVNKPESYLKKTYELAKKCKSLILSGRSQLLTPKLIESINNKIEFTFQTYYIDLFSIKDVKKYIKKNPNLRGFKKRNTAINLVLSSKDVDEKHIFYRPFLLSKIEFFVENKSVKKYEYNFQVYETLLFEWTKRERIKYFKDNDNKNIKESEFNDFVNYICKHLALLLVKETNRKLKIKESDIIHFLPGKKKKKENLKTVSQIRTFLMYSSNYLQFAHRSILEYFIAELLFDAHISEQHFVENEKHIFYPEAYKFYYEMIDCRLCEDKSVKEFYNQNIVTEHILEFTNYNTDHQFLKNTMEIWSNSTFNIWMLTVYSVIESNQKYNNNSTYQYLNEIIKYWFDCYHEKSNSLIQSLCEIVNSNLTKTDKRKWHFLNDYEIELNTIDSIINTNGLGWDEPKNYLFELRNGAYKFKYRWMYEFFVIKYIIDNDINYDIKQKINFNKQYTDEINWISYIKPYFNQYNINISYEEFRDNTVLNLASYNIKAIDIFKYFPKISNIRTINLSKNKLQSIPCFYHLENISVNLSYNNVKGISDTDISNLQNMANVNLANNKIDTIPNDLSELRKINSLILCKNPLPKEVLEEFCPSIEPQTTLIKGANFLMGSNEYDNEKPIHEVKLDDYYMGKYPVTVEEFKAFIDDTDYKTDADKGGGSYIWERSDWNKKKGVNWQCDVKGNKRPESEYRHPVIHVSWNDAKAYCQWLSQKTGKQYRLPTEAEWEFAAGGGINSPHVATRRGVSLQRLQKYAGTDKEEKLKEYAWYLDNSGETTHEVGSLKPNLLGLYDMSGNVWEWCEDWWDEKYYQKLKDSEEYKNKGFVLNPFCTDKTTGFRVLRGGSWNGSTNNCRVAYRNGNFPDGRSGLNGFRVCSSAL